MMFSVSSRLVIAQDSISLLADAVENKNWMQSNELIASGTNVNTAQVDGMTALHWATYYDKLELVKKLVTAGANVKMKNRYGVSVLYLSCLNGNETIVELILNHGGEPNLALRSGETPLMTAARTGKPGPVQLLLVRGADIESKDRNDQTAIMWAAAEGNLEVVDILIEAGADFQTPLQSGFTPLFFAIREGRIDVVVRLLNAGIDVNETMKIEKKSSNGAASGTTPLMMAVENGHFELAAKLLELGADPNENRTGFTPLHAMTWIRKPLRGDGDPPPIGSGKMSSLEFVNLLIKQGAKINARHDKHSSGNQRLNKTDATPFLLAAETGDLPLLRLMIDLGADPDLKNADNVTPLLAACGVGILSNGDESAGTEEDAIATVKLLLEHGADVNAIDDRNNTAMHGAAYKSWPKLVTYLSENGADIEQWNCQNHFKRTPLEIAQGHRPGNFRPSTETTNAIERVMLVD
ncbi:MAG TPA: hypothetical protein DD473_19270 [Planctomycetaceae bacterium]|nr:hypothetical protein [Planctomycetaceae bacterium]